ncbi:hypothetical protein SHIRM173S_09701 [Streptomyces hirsutus]
MALLPDGSYLTRIGGLRLRSTGPFFYALLLTLSPEQEPCSMIRAADR